MKKRITLRQQVGQLEKQNLDLRCDKADLEERVRRLESRYVKEVGDRDRQINTLTDRVCELQRGDISETVCGLKLGLKHAREEINVLRLRLALASNELAETGRRERVRVRRAKQLAEQKPKRKTKKR